jgi:hypothetical protein
MGEVEVTYAHTGHWIADLALLAPVVVVLGWVLIANYRGRRRQGKPAAREHAKDGRDRSG